MALPPTIIMLMPSAGGSYGCASGNTYAASSQGIVTNVLVGDVSSLQIQGGIVLEPRNNTYATSNPTVNNDYTQGYGVGSIWGNITLSTLWFCTAMGTTPGSATWTQLAATSPQVSEVGQTVTTNNVTLGITTTIVLCNNGTGAAFNLIAHAGMAAYARLRITDIGTPGASGTGFGRYPCTFSISGGLVRGLATWVMAVDGTSEVFNSDGTNLW